MSTQPAVEQFVVEELESLSRDYEVLRSAALNDQCAVCQERGGERPQRAHLPPEFLFTHRVDRVAPAMSSLGVPS